MIFFSHLFLPNKEDEQPQPQPIANAVPATPDAFAEPQPPQPQPTPSAAKLLSKGADVQKQVPRLRKTSQWKHVVEALHRSQRPTPKTQYQKREMTNQDDGELFGIKHMRSYVDDAVRVDAYLASQALHGKANNKTGPVHCQVHIFLCKV